MSLSPGASVARLVETGAPPGRLVGLDDERAGAVLERVGVNRPLAVLVLDERRTSTRRTAVGWRTRCTSRRLGSSRGANRSLSALRSVELTPSAATIRSACSTSASDTSCSNRRSTRASCARSCSSANSDLRAIARSRARRSAGGGRCGGPRCRSSPRRSRRCAARQLGVGAGEAAERALAEHDAEAERRVARRCARSTMTSALGSRRLSRRRQEQPARAAADNRDRDHRLAPPPRNRFADVVAQRLLVDLADLGDREVVDQLQTFRQLVLRDPLARAGTPSELGQRQRLGAVAQHGVHARPLAEHRVGHRDRGDARRRRVARARGSRSPRRRSSRRRG